MIALRTASLSGLWIRAGIDGSICGLDVSAALSAAAARGAQQGGPLVGYLEAIEAGVLDVVERRRKFRE